jgi:hypothetical protein
MDGSDETLRAVIGQFTARMEVRNVAVSHEPVREIAAPAEMGISTRRRGGAEKKRTLPHGRAISRGSQIGASAAPAREGETAAKIRELLKHRPMTSGELIKALPECTPAAIYALLGVWRKNGTTEMVENPDGLGHKNRLVTT